MKKIILAITLVSGLTLATKAQDGSKSDQNETRHQRKHGSPEERIKKNADWAEQKLGLNAEQKSKWEAADRERIAANSPLKEKLNGSTTPEERKELRKSFSSNNKKFETDVAAFLTPEQKVKYDQIKKERHEHRKNRKDHKNPKKHFQRDSDK